MYYYLLNNNKESILNKDHKEEHDILIRPGAPSKNVGESGSPQKNPKIITMMRGLSSRLESAIGASDEMDVQLSKSENIIQCDDLNFLHKVYEPEYWYWEIVETMRRLLFTAILVLANTSSNLQICFSIIMSVIFI